MKNSLYPNFYMWKITGKIADKGTEVGGVSRGEGIMNDKQ